MMSIPPILFCPVPQSEGWTSINLQEGNILEALQRVHPDLVVHQLKPVSLATRWLRPLLRDFHYPELIRSELGCYGRESIVHVSDHSYAHLCRLHPRTVINCNDLHHHIHPDLGAMQLLRWRKRVDGMREATRIITISDYLAGEVRDFMNLPETQVIGMLGGVDHGTFQPIDPKMAANIVPELGKERDSLLVLNIGSNQKRKNLPTVLRAIHRLREHDKLPVKLVKVGAPLMTSVHRDLIHQLGLEDAVIDLGQLSASQVAAACTLCHCLSFASYYEGFGRPTVEAQACGLPCVLADASCMREVGGEGALYHSPMSEEDLAGKLALVLTDDTLRARLIAAGLINSKRFCWDAYARRLVAVYQELAN